MMGRGGSDNYKINQGDTIETDEAGNIVLGDYGVAGDVINEIGGSSADKSDSITLSSAQSIDQLSFPGLTSKMKALVIHLRLI